MFLFCFTTILNQASYMTCTFDSEVSLHHWLLWPTVRPATGSRRPAAGDRRGGCRCGSSDQQRAVRKHANPSVWRRKLDDGCCHRCHVKRRPRHSKLMIGFHQSRTAAAAQWDGHVALPVFNSWQDQRLRASSPRLAWRLLTTLRVSFDAFFGIRIKIYSGYLRRLWLRRGKI